MTVAVRDRDGRAGARAAARALRRAAALRPRSCSAAGCVLLVIVGLDAALGGAQPDASNLGDWLGFGHSALRADGLAGIFLALTGVTGAAVSLAVRRAPRRAAG